MDTHIIDVLAWIYFNSLKILANTLKDRLFQHKLWKSHFNAHAM